ncbi:TIGR03905 family TSCPD domain-containing protein [Clostridium aestuarii]|uniref:ribonucleoside-diphosphate reductase n=1 Tax=Clostridium aestuarii TaxID=338193 RepID=A0ABT4CWS9_9CLOT|nr:TIGR03905 family TSCPD domain-containing protein [Clostridium aestuarii]MCY6482797.1 TIGR03905 family TSCPD domain-containing protein [Clostridium aestuarii]
MYTYKTKGTCSREINFDIQDNKIKNVSFIGGCNGNLKGISNLIEGMEIEDVIKKLSDIKCGSRDTSCPDQLASALKELI